MELRRTLRVKFEVLMTELDEMLVLEVLVRQTGVTDIENDHLRPGKSRRDIPW
jgi:hypothetical protein